MIIGVAIIRYVYNLRIITLSATSMNKSILLQSMGQDFQNMLLNARTGFVMENDQVPILFKANNPNYSSSSKYEKLPNFIHN